MENAAFVETVREIVLLDGSRLRVPNSAQIQIDSWETEEVPF